ncbi:MAG TPA: MoxR family ATPase, partial [Polyangiaceae bacterium]|nr:MoxR family ATPase [Polyangiaceae bacterium]
KVQAALLEAMEERQVTAAGKSQPLPQPFMVLATQNPIEQEGTYPLPEAQLDRFLMHVHVDYPDKDAELEILHLVRGEEGTSAGAQSQRLPSEAILTARREIKDVKLSDTVERYLVDLILATRPPRELDEKLGLWLEVGASPRATIALDRCARAKAWLSGRSHVTPDDVRAVVHAVLRHRLILRYEATADGVTANDVVDHLLKVVAIAG